MSAEELRLECLRLAHHQYDDKSQVVERARAYHDFLLGALDAEIIDAARALAKRIG